MTKKISKNYFKIVEDMRNIPAIKNMFIGTSMGILKNLKNKNFEQSKFCAGFLKKKNSSDDEFVAALYICAAILRKNKKISNIQYCGFLKGLEE